jgi:hypothetical protein
MQNRLTLCVAILLALPGRAGAQQYQYAYGNDDKVQALAKKTPTDRSLMDIEDALTILDGQNASKLFFLSAGYSKFLQQVESVRMDKQTGASPSSQGTTSVVSKGVASQVLSLATEEGALTRTDSKTTSTFQANGLGTARMIVGAEQFPYCAIYDYRCESVASRTLRGLSAGVSFYTAPSSNNASNSSGTSTNNNNVLNASTQTVAGWNLRYDFHVRRNLKDMASGYQTQFNQQYKSAGADGAAMLLAIAKITDPLVLPPTGHPPVDFHQMYLDWQDTYAKALKSADAKDFNGILMQALTKLVGIAKQADPNFQSDADNVISKMSTYFGNTDALLSDYVNAVTFSVEYDDTMPVDQPSQSTAKFILSARPKGFQLTANASVELYNRLLQSNVSRVRDAQASVQLDRKFGTSNSAVSPTLSAGYYFQYMVANALLSLPSTDFAPGTTIPLPGSASVLLNTTGSVHLGQAKVTLSIRNTGINFPIALTFSNRTDLIKATDVRGNFGITYDLDSLFAKK